MNDREVLTKVSNELRIIIETLDVYGAQRRAKVLKKTVDDHLKDE